MPRHKHVAPKRGDIIYTNFDPAAGSEQRLGRPALVLSPEPFNAKIQLALVAPISSKKRGHGFEVELTGAETQGVVLCHQVKVIDYGERGCKFLEEVPRRVLSEVLAKVRLLVS